MTIDKSKALQDKLIEIGLPVFRVPEVLWFSEAVIYFALQSKKSHRILLGSITKRPKRIKAFQLIENIVMKRNRNALHAMVRQKLSYEIVEQMALSRHLADKVADYLVPLYVTNLLKVLSATASPNKQLLFFFSSPKPLNKVLTN